MKYIYAKLPDFIEMLLRKAALVFAFSIMVISQAAAQKTTVASGKFSDPAIWNTPGTPVPSDQVTIQSGHVVEMDSDAVVKYLTIQDGATLTIGNQHTLTLTDGTIINGRLNVTEGNITLQNIGSPFKMGPNGYLQWAPANNTASGTSLFLNGIEDFNAGSTLNIEKWFNYTNTPLGSVVTGNFGNIIINTISNGLIYEWDQKNYFEQHVIMGTLSINQGWVILDKSGAIQNTFINAIHLNNINSYLEFHSGNHPGTFTVRTNEIKNTGGTINGIVNGNGNVRLDVNGNFTNLGNVCLIYNSGVINTGNGNATLKISGKYTQTHGDFRGIFNITTTTSGKPEIEIGEAEITGGIFMANYACHTAAQTSKIRINGNLALNFSSSNGKFRGNGLTTLSGVQNNLKLLFTIGGNLTMNGIAGSEFISSGSAGSETVQIAGNAQFSGGNAMFNAGSHPTEIIIEKSLNANGGAVYLSKSSGTLNATIYQDFNITSGNISIKGHNGYANVTVLGNYNQTGGTVTFHDNITEPTANIIYFAVHGNFTNNSGTLTFDNNSASAAGHHLSLNGSTFTIGGTAQINSATGHPGVIYYDHIGPLAYHAISAQALIQSVKQIISSGCILQIITGNMQAASTNSPANDQIRVAGGGVLDLGVQQVYSNRQGLYSGILVDEDGKLRTAAKAGLYDGTANASIHPLGNMSYALHSNSTVEYYGGETQVITGNGTGAAQTAEQQYGMIEINKPSAKAILKASDVFIRTGLYLNKGELDLNGYNITILSGKTHSITRTEGYIRSEPENLASGGQVKWRNIEQGYHVIPFGVDAQKIIPVTFSPNTGFGREFSVSTKRSLKDNRPLPAGITNLNIYDTDAGNDKIIDRWYYIQAQSVSADITLGYLPEENTTQPGYATGNFSVMQWGSQKWNVLGGTGNGTVSQSGKVTLNNCSNWGHMLLASHEAPQPADILQFTAQLVTKQVNLNWISKANILAEKYAIERSGDEINYVTIIEQPAMPHSVSAQDYSATDLNPLPGISHYRLKQFGADGTVKYSNLVKIDNSTTNNGISLLTTGPNPFNDYFTATFSAGLDGPVDITLTTLTGQKIHSESIEAVQGKNTFRYTSDGSLITGIYLLSISDGKTRATQKLFKK